MAAEVEIFVLPNVNQGRRLYEVAKRSLDVVVALIALVLLAPVLALCVLAIRLDSPGPVLFRQQRVGKQGKRFTMIKFRSMYVDAESAVHRAYATAFVRGEAKPQQGEQGAVFKLAADARVTRVGKWLRQMSLDELPQLWNALCGDMSLVGPRPPIPYEVDHYEPNHLGRLAVKPGITGPWQVSGRSATTFEEMVAIDLEYIQRSSFLLDLRILVMTIPAVLGARGAH